MLPSSASPPWDPRTAAPGRSASPPSSSEPQARCRPAQAAMASCGQTSYLKAVWPEIVGSVFDSLSEGIVLLCLARRAGSGPVVAVLGRLLAVWGSCRPPDPPQVNSKKFWVWARPGGSRRPDHFASMAFSHPPNPPKGAPPQREATVSAGGLPPPGPPAGKQQETLGLGQTWREREPEARPLCINCLFPVCPRSSRPFLFTTKGLGTDPELLGTNHVLCVVVWARPLSHSGDLKP
jgi:hypothetical protein